MNILIVDDDAMIRNWLTIMINQIGSYAIASVSNVPEALTHCAQHDVDLVITDITMPGQTGLDLITELNQRNPAIKTAVLSAYDDYKYIRTALQLGALDYVLKSEMSIDDIRSLLKKLDLFAEYATEGEINKNPSRTVPDLLAHNQSFRDWLHDDSQLNTFPAGLDEITSKNVVIIVLHLDVVLSYDKESSEYIEICERTFESENIFGKTAWIDGGILIACIDSNTHVEEYKIQIGQKISLLLQRNLHHYANCETLHDWVFVSAESLQFKNLVRETIETCKTRTYYSLGKYIEPGLLAGTNISQVYNVTSAHLQKQDVETAISAAVSFLEECHTSYCPPDRIKTAVIHVLNAFTACDQTITANMAFSATYRRTMKAVCYATKKR